MDLRSTCSIDDRETKDCSPRSLPRKFSTSSTMRILRERSRPGRRHSVFVNHRSTFSHFTSSFLILTIVLSTLCSFVVATSDRSCSVGRNNPFSRPNSHSFVLGRRAQQDEINEITIDSRSDPQSLNPERQQSNDDKSQPLDSSEHSQPSDKESNAGPGAGDDNSPGDPSGQSNTKQDGNGEAGKDHSNSRTTSAQGQSSNTITSTASDLKITATGTISAESAIQTNPTIESEDDLPKPFDTNIGSNFTNPNCPKFIRELEKNSTFNDCYPMSMFLKNSDSFFQISASAPALSRVLDESCGVSQSDCTAIMTDLASRLSDDSVCGEDLDNRQPTVTGAYEGLIAYGPMYRATCLKNPDTHSYCFVDASTNSSNFEDSYIYLVGMGYDLPPGSRLTCDRCLQATMEIFADTARIKGQPLVNTYIPAAQIIDLGCPNLVNTTVQVGTLPAVDAAAPGSLLKSGSMLMGYVSILSVGVMFLLF